MNEPFRIPGMEIIEWGGEKLGLLSERALWWPDRKTLLIADPHFGKAATFRHAGIPVPETTHDDDIARLDAILRITRSRRLVILGDFFHANAGLGDAVIGALSAWRRRNAELEVVLIEGNHDRHAGDPPREWRIHTVRPPWKLGHFTCVHEPVEIGDDFVFAGHIHPSFYLRDRVASGLEYPCFHFGERVAVLPAFGNFTGSHPMKISPGDMVFIVGEKEIIDVSSAARRSRRK